MEIDSDKIFGLRIKRVAELIGDQGSEAFWRTGISLDARLTSVVIALSRKSGQSSSEVASVTGLSRQLIESRLKQLEQDGYVTSKIGEADARKRVYSLSPGKSRELARIVETMVDFEKVYDALWREIGVDLGDAIMQLERALYAKPLLARLCHEFPQYGDRIKVSSGEV